MITEKGKEYIARNFGVNNCFALEEVVPCTVYTEGTPNERVLDTSTILFVLVTEVAERVKTAAGTFTLADLVAANSGSYISMMDALGIEAYCITGAPPVTPPYIPPYTPPYTPYMIDAMDATTNWGWFGAGSGMTLDTVTKHEGRGALSLLKNNRGTGAAWYNQSNVTGIDLTNKHVKFWLYIKDATARNKITIIDFLLWESDTSRGKWRFPVAGLSIGWNLLELDTASEPYEKLGTPNYAAINGTYIYAYTHNASDVFVAGDLIADHIHYTVPGAPPVTPPYIPPYTPPVTAKITKAGIITELRGRGAINTTGISTTSGTYKWYMYMGRLHYDTLNFEKAISIRNLATRNPPTQTTDISLTENKTSVNELDRSWVLARLGELPYGAAPPVTPPYIPPYTPPSVSKKEIEIVSPSVNCDNYKCYARFDLKNNASSASAYIRLEVDGAARYKRRVYLLRGATKPQVLSTSVTGLSDGYHNLTIAVGKVVDTDTYTHKFLVGVGIEPPLAKITKAEIATELGKRGAIDTSGISTTVGKDYWYIVHGEWGSGPWVNYVATNFIKSITLDIAVRNPPTRVSDITLKANHNVVNELDRSWVLARLAELPGAPAAPPYTPPVTPAALTVIVNAQGYTIKNQKDRATFTCIPVSIAPEKYECTLWLGLEGQSGMTPSAAGTSCGNFKIIFFKMKGGTWVVDEVKSSPCAGLFRYTGTATGITLTMIPPVTPPYIPPYTPPVPGVSEAIKAWIVANYGDGTRVTTDGWRKLNVAKMANALAALPAGYTKASITEGVVLWAKANPNWESQTICGWISAIGVTNLTEDHGLYVYNLAIGWTTLANSIYATLSPKPSKPPSAIITEDNGLGVYDYAIGWNTIANTITGCNF